MAFDRSKYKATRLKELEEEEEIVKEMTGFDSAFDRIEEGRNKFRIYPKHADSKAYAYARISHWLPVELERDGKKEWRRLPIPDARKHGGFKEDIVDQYIKFVNRMIKEEGFDEKENKRITGIIRDFKTGIEANSSWIAYMGRGTAAGWKEAKLLEFGASVKNGLNQLSITEDENDPTAIDSFTDIDTGRPILIKYNSKEEDNRKKYVVNKLDDAVELTDEQLIYFEDLDSLEILYGATSFTKKDFDQELAGVQQYDAENEIGAFDSDDWLDICERLLAEVEKEFSEEKSKIVEKKVVIDELEDAPGEELEDEDPLEGLDLVGLKKFSDSRNLGVKVYKNSQIEVIKKKITSALEVATEEVPQKEVKKESFPEKTIEKEVVSNGVSSASERLAKMKASLKK